MTSLRFNWMTAASMAVVSFTAPCAFAQDANTPGIVRITDSKPRVAAQQASFHGHRAAAYSDYGNCPTGDCPNCPSGHCHHGCYLFRETYCKNSPDYGYSPPAKYPLQRRGVQYNAYFPNQWYGAGASLAGGYPMVYQPTDTTQLGFYYQHVPFWQPNPNMMPQRPVPAQWHIVAPPVHASSFHKGQWQGGYLNGNCPVDQGVIIQGTESMSTPVPLQPTPAEAAAPMPEAGLPPSPREIQSAESDHIRRAAF